MPNFSAPRTVSTRRATLALSTLLAASALATTLPVAAASSSPAAVPFDTFVHGLADARASAFVGQQGMAVHDDAAFEEIRAHLLKIYQGLDVRRSVVVDGQTVDCVPVADQPAMRLQKLKSVATPPPFSPQTALGRPAGPADKLAGMEAQPNAAGCLRGTFAMPRTTLEQVAKFGSLKAFFAKGPGGAGQAHRAPSSGHGTIQPMNSGGHAYSYAYQNVANIGGSSVESLYSPPIYSSLGEVFSLEQQWYIGYNHGVTQTAEVGWQNYPGRVGGGNSTLFAYYTADGYVNTGCYDYTCGKFVAYGSSPISLGSTWSAYSTAGGSQYTITLGFYFWQGNWWLAYGTGWVGYYPGTLYGSGPMATGNSSQIEFGTESVGSSYWPQEGSGRFASAGWPYAAYQRTLKYRDGSGLHDTSLTTVQPSPSCYTTTPQTYGGSTWQQYFYLGGPGGSGC